MQNVNQVLNSNSYRKLTKTSIAIEPLTIEEQDQLLDAFSDIIDPDYRLWFVIRLKEVGKTKFVEAGEKARKYANDPHRLFAYLLK